ncbi:MAG: MFS transporter [Novosphingobium pentaromativorans]|uniref:MFS transporter n=1 Tax=Novosphingobium pentaromativorans TaxID=205844 RepID=A0A2W5NVV3_9SPHN|nr:MAG: MFS transporter [Novosphingobium pentaromativorans]
MTASPHASSTPAHSTPQVWLPLLALVLLGCNLRSPLTAVQPVLGQIRESLDLGTVGAGLLTSIPVLSFGLLPPIVSPLIARLGIDRSIQSILLIVTFAVIFRPFAGVAGLFAGTLLIGLCLAVGNIVSLMLIARDFAGRTNLVTGLYTISLNLGAMLTLGLTAPMADRFGWRVALATWAGLALAAMALRWAASAGTPETGVSVNRELSHPSETMPSTPAPVLIMALAFSVHIFAYYSLTAWLPTYLAGAGGMSVTEAGIVASSFQILSLTGSLGVPLLARHVSLGKLLIAMGLIWTITPIWILLAPGQWLLWSPIGSIAHGGTFVLVFMMIMKFTRSVDENRRASTKVQSIGYCFAALGPILTGWLQGAGWWAAFGMIAAVTTLLVPLGLLLTRYENRL